MKSKRYADIILAVLIIVVSGCGSGRTAEQERIATHVAELLSQTETSTIEPSPEPLISIITPKPVETEQQTYKALKLGFFYGLPVDQMDPKLLVDNIRLYISSIGLEDERDILRRLGSNVPYFQYVLFSEIENPGSCEVKPFSDHVADKIGDFCRIDIENPEWFLTTNNGDRIHTEPPYDSYWILDPGNQSWREFWLSRMQARENLGWDGIFLDNLEGRHRDDDLILNKAQYIDEASYQQATVQFLKYIYEYFSSKNIPVFANIIAVAEISDWTQFLPYLDGAMLEDFAMDWDSGYYSVQRWEQQLEIARITQAMGKEIILVSQGDQGDIDRQEFALASYLLIQDGKAYFRYTKLGSYSEFWMYNNYLQDPGQPLGSMYQEGDYWLRNFEYGYVMVNPATHTADIVITQ
jgi:hypothetical protein